MKREKLSSDGTHFFDWYCGLRVALRHELKEYILNSTRPEIQHDLNPEDEVTKFEKHMTDELIVYDLIVGTMDSELRKQFGNFPSYTIQDKLKERFREQVRIDRYKVTKNLFGAKMFESDSIDAHMMTMMSYIERLELLDSPMDMGLATDIILSSLPPSYEGFIKNYHMNGKERSLEELYWMLMVVEGNMKKEISYSFLKASERDNEIEIGEVEHKTETKSKGKGKERVATSNHLKAKAEIPSNEKCFYSKNIGHWKRYCAKYLNDLESGRVSISSSILMSTLLPLPMTRYWIPKNMPICFSICRQFKVGDCLVTEEMQLRVRNGTRVSCSHEIQECLVALAQKALINELCIFYFNL